jgi:hypothetical protein
MAIGRGWGFRDMNLSEGHKSEDLDAWQRQWEKTRKRGLFEFVLISGLVDWGIGSFVFMAGMDFLSHHLMIGTRELRDIALVTLPAGFCMGSRFGIRVKGATRSY